MKYNPPPGAAADAPYADGNRNAGIRGSVVPAAAIEYPQRELVNLIGYAGLTPDNADLNQVRKAIEALIAAATGGGDTSQFLLVAQAASRLPIYPEIVSADGKMNVSSPAAGTILVPSAVTIMHRGIRPYETGDYDEATERTFATAASKTYHLRWSPTDGFALKDVADAGYNPTAKPETDASFDSTYDDMLIARIVTNGSNVATITNLANKARLQYQGVVNTGAAIVTTGSGNDGTQLTHTFTLDFARTPDVIFSGYAGQAGGGLYYVSAYANAISTVAKSRYSAQGSVQTDFLGTVTGTPVGSLNLIAIC